MTGEAAGLALGLVELGSKSEDAIRDMVAYAQETQHEKILRGLAVGIGLVMYGRLEEADPLIESLCNDKDAILRRSGMYTIAMAYCGTGKIMFEATQASVEVVAPMTESDSWGMMGAYMGKFKTLTQSV